MNSYSHTYVCGVGNHLGWALTSREAQPVPPHTKSELSPHELCVGVGMK